jgi:hypothetical protein
MKEESLKNLIKSKKFDWVNPNITESVFPLQEVRGTDYKLFQFDKSVSSESAVKEMEKEGYIPANLHELLLWTEWNNRDFVVALGSVGEVNGGRRVPFLRKGGSERRLGLGWWDGGWVSVFRFLAVRNLSLNTSDTLNQALGNSESLSLAIETCKKEGSEENKCEKAGLQHAWRSSDYVVGFSVQTEQTCANCGLKRQKNYESKEWWSYSDGRDSEPIMSIRPA